MAIQPRPHQTGGGNPGPHQLAGDTTYTKIFVGGLAWETQRDTMRRYFEQFGEVLEAVVITDKNTGRSKGYGFVTFRDPDSAARACVDPSPVIDGRRANCNLASLGATHRTRPPTPQYGMGRFRPPAATVMAASAYRGTSPASVSTAYFHHPTQYALPYSFYGYSGGYSQENNMYPMSYYGIGGGQQQQQQHQFSPYYPATPAGVLPNFYPYYGHYTHSVGQGQGGFGLHYPQMIQYPYLSQQFGSASAILSLPTSIAAPTAGLNVVGAPPIGSGPSSSLSPGTNQDQKPSS